MNSKYLVKNTGTGVTKVNKAGLTLAPACVPRCSLFFAPAACHTCQPQESKGQTNICTHPSSLPTVAELSSECPPSFMRPHTLKLPFLALLNRQVPQALPFLQCKRRHLTLVPICLSLPPTSPGSVEMICRTMRMLLTQPLTHLQQPSSLPLPWNGNYFKAISLTQGSLLPGTDSCGLFLQDFCPLPKLSSLGTQHAHTGVHTFHRSGSLYST